jgi:hypothetical protein
VLGKDGKTVGQVGGAFGGGYFGTQAGASLATYLGLTVPASVIGTGSVITGGAALTGGLITGGGTAPVGAVTGYTGTIEGGTSAGIGLGLSGAQLTGLVAIAYIASQLDWGNDGFLGVMGGLLSPGSWGSSGYVNRVQPESYIKDLFALTASHTQTVDNTPSYINGVPYTNRGLVEAKYLQQISDAIAWSLGTDQIDSIKTAVGLPSPMLGNYTYAGQTFHLPDRNSWKSDPAWADDDRIATLMENVGWDYGYAKGGFANRPSIFAEKGGEWAAPTYNPEKSDFLESTGVAKKLREVLNETNSRNGGSGRPIIHTHVYLDRREIALAIADEAEVNPRLKARLN